MNAHVCIYTWLCIYQCTQHLCLCVLWVGIYKSICVCVCLQIKPYAYNLVTIKHVTVVVLSCFREVFWLALVINFDIPRWRNVEMIQFEMILKQKKAFKKTILFLSANSEALINLGWNEIMNLFCFVITSPVPSLPVTAPLLSPAPPRVTPGDSSDHFPRK